jgi:hypothetical protein
MAVARDPIPSVHSGLLVPLAEATSYALTEGVGECEASVGGCHEFTEGEWRAFLHEERS